MVETLKLKKQIEGETWYNLRTIQIIIGLISIPIIAIIYLLLNWFLAAFLAIWILIGIVQIQVKWINEGELYAPDV